MRSLFGDIRAQVHRDAGRDPDALAEMLWRARKEDASRYEAQVLPYLEGFELPVFTCTARWQLERLVQLLPAQAHIKILLDDEPGVMARVEHLCQSAHLDAITELEVRSGAHLNAASIEALLTHEGMTGLVGLWLEGSEIDSGVLEALSLSNASRHLEQLSVSNSSYHHALMPGLRALIDAGVLGRLRRFEYEPYSLIEGEDRVLDALARANTRRLEHLRVRGYNDQIDTSSARVLARSHALMRRLRSLDLSRCELEPEALAELVNVDSVARLEVLNLGDNHLGEEGARLLARSSHLGRLRSLNLWRNQLQNAGFECVMRSSLMGHMQVLNVRGNWLDARGIAGMCEAPSRATLHTLWLGHNQLGDEGASWLWRVPLTGRLTRLGLQSNGIEARGFQGLEVIEGQLEEMYVDFNEPGESGIGALARSRATRRLHSLGLMWCVIEDEGLDALSRGAFSRKLRALDVSHNGLSTASLVRFIEGGGLERPERLSMAGNRLGDEAFVAMHRQRWLEHMSTLDLSQNRLGVGTVDLLEEMDVGTLLPEIVISGNAHEVRMRRAIEARRGFLSRA